MKKNQQMPQTRIALIVSSWGAAILFLILAYQISRKRTFSFDETILRWLHAHATSFWDQFFLVITNIGGIIGVVVATATICLLLYKKRQYSQVLLLIVTVVGASLVNIVLKDIFQRPRPELWHQLIVEHSYSFPSGHAVASSAFAFALIGILWHTRLRWLSIIFGISLVFLVGLSRLYLGVHYPSDIVAGWCVSLIWAIVVARLYGKSDSTSRLT